MLRPSLYLPMVVVASTCKEMTLRWRADDFRKEHVLILVSSPFCVSIEMRRRSLSLSLSQLALFACSRPQLPAAGSCRRRLGAFGEVVTA